MLLPCWFFSFLRRGGGRRFVCLPNPSSCRLFHSWGCRSYPQLTLRLQTRNPICPLVPCRANAAPVCSWTDANFLPARELPHHTLQSVVNLVVCGASSLCRHPSSPAGKELWTPNTCPITQETIGDSVKGAPAE